MKNHEFNEFDSVTKSNGDLIIFVTLSKYGMVYEDVEEGDTINGQYEILEMDRMKDMLYGYKNQSAGYRVKML